MRRLTALAAALTLLLAGCGDSKRQPDPEVEVRETLQTYVASVRDKDAEQLCELIDPDVLEAITAIGLPCEAAMRQQYFTSVESPRLTVGKIAVDGETAQAEVKTSAAGQPPAAATIALRLVNGEWKLSTEAETAPTGPSGPTGSPRPAQPIPD